MTLATLESIAIYAIMFLFFAFAAGVCVSIIIAVIELLSS